MSDKNHTSWPLDLHRRARGRTRAALALLGALLAAMLLLSACGGGSKGTSSTTSSTATSTAQRFAARATALRACLQRNGVSLPQRKADQPGQGGPFGPGGNLPKGVTREKLRAAMSKCGGDFGAGRRFGARNSQRLKAFAACMQQNGVHLPAPNTSGKGPVFDTKGVDTASATFKKADTKCASQLFRGAGGPPGGPGGGPGAGPPGA
jgi:hypothetical protein